MSKTHTTIEAYIIEAVKKRRLKMDINPHRLSLELGIVHDFVGRTEAYTRGYKYNSNHLNELAKILDCNIPTSIPRNLLRKTVSKNTTKSASKGGRNWKD